MRCVSLTFEYIQFFIVGDGVRHSVVKCLSLNGTVVIWCYFVVLVFFATYKMTDYKTD